MDEKMQLVETTLGETAKKCNTVALDRLLTNLASYDSQYQSRQSDALASVYPSAANGHS
jgi:hypothetical protein